MANEDEMNSDATMAANTNEESSNTTDASEPRIIGWFYAYDADHEPEDATQLIWVSLEEPNGGERQISIHAGDLIKQHAENRQLLLTDVTLLAQSLAEYEDANAKDITFRRYAFSCSEELPEGVMPIARFTAELSNGDEGVTVLHRCAVNAQLKKEVLVGAQRLSTGMTEHLPQLFEQLENAEQNTSNTATITQTQSVTVEPSDGAQPSADAITDIASIAADMAAINGEPDASAGSSNRESQVFGYFYAYDMNVPVEDPGAVAKINVDEPDSESDGKAKLEFSLSSFITDNVDNCGALLAFASQLYDVLPKSKQNGSIYRRYAFTNRPEPPKNTLPLGRIVVELENGKPVGSHCETPGDEKLHDDLIGAAHIIETFGPYIRQVFDQKKAETGADGDNRG